MSAQNRRNRLAMQSSQKSSHHRLFRRARRSTPMLVRRKSRACSSVGSRPCAVANDRLPKWRATTVLGCCAVVVDKQVTMVSMGANVPPRWSGVSPVRTTRRIDDSRSTLRPFVSPRRAVEFDSL
jgi:hypothetical protein